MAAPASLRDFARTVLESGSLKAKLRAPVDEEGALLDDRAPGPALVIDAPARDDVLAFRTGSDKLPKLTALREHSARAACLERFAGHELQAIELFAWALLAFPDAPRGLRRGWAQALREEQDHLVRYRDRLRAHGGDLGERPCSDYFWRFVPGIRHSADPILAFMCALGLTLEQANLDFTLLYRDAFRDAGDDDTARVIQRVHDDEIRHVALAARWTARLHDGDLVDTYQRHVPFPLSGARAKGRRFDARARAAAGLPDTFIAHVDAARPYDRS